jgi:FtsP/CotA-like multicopper oxidase with cupredoxin domain
MTRRAAIKRGVAGAAGLVATGKVLSATERAALPDMGLHSNRTVGEALAAGIDPHAYLTDFDYGDVSVLDDGRTLRQYTVVASERELEVAPGVFFPAWTYDGRVPGPTIRATEGDVVRVNFHNAGQHHHTIHFHGFHAANMDGVFEQVPPGGDFVYEFTAAPSGLHLYHCHTMPLRRHVAKGLYGVFLVDPKVPRPPANEMVMVMNGFDVNFDGENEIYAVNTVPFAYQQRPIQIRRGERQRIYLVNVLEFDLVNSFHLHGNFFEVYRTGTRRDPSDFTDTLMMCQGERHVIEFTYEHEGRFMFHAHQSEFAELGWTGVLEVVETLA